VLGDFFVNGRLKTIPAQRKKKDIVVRYLAQQFEYGRAYTEQEVNFKLLDFHEDYATLRREMIDTKLMRRENGIYQRLTAAAGAV
jgi:ArsR family transcriptional regulator